VEKIRQVRQRIAQEYLGKAKLQGDYLRRQEKHAPGRPADAESAKSVSRVREEPGSKPWEF
jgi:hypothetical protein